MKAGLSTDEIEELINKHWIFRVFWCILEGFGEEESMIYYIALKFAGNKIIADPKRYRPEAHDELIKAGIPVDQYAIPALFKDVEIKTGTNLDKKLAEWILENKKDWHNSIEKMK